MELIELDQRHLMSTVLPGIRPTAGLSSPRLLERMWSGARQVLDEFGADCPSVATSWGSDVARGWGAMSVGVIADLSFERRLQLLRPFAQDHHFAVREWAWLAVRRYVIEDPTAALMSLTPWASADEDKLRRFASEATRPRGVWCVHVPLLKRSPELAEGLLALMWKDSARYVQLSVGNWLNDASKTRPDWVERIARRWGRSHDPRTTFILRRALRTMPGHRLD